MLVLFLKTFKYIFLYFFPLNNKCASEYAHRSFSTWHFLSAVDGWLSMRIHTISTPSPRHLHHSILPSIQLSTCRPSCAMRSINLPSNPWSHLRHSLSINGTFTSNSRAPRFDFSHRICHRSYTFPLMDFREEASRCGR